MPWKRITPVQHKIHFISDFMKEKWSMTELCARYQISRKTGYALINRYIEEGPSGLEIKSSRPKNSPRRTPEKIVKAILEVRHRHPTWGSKKVLKVIENRHPDWTLPHRATVCLFFAQAGLVKRKTRRRKVGHPGKPFNDITAPNDLWCTDFKGQFKMGNGEYCFPLTVTDAFSRTLLACDGYDSTSTEGVIRSFTRIFKEYGLPRRIRSDNGAPFASSGLGRLSRLSVWWIRLGIKPELIEPGHPQQNGRHERMHRTLKAETTLPPAKNFRGQQRKFDLFMDEYNNERPHEALDLNTPATCYVPSTRLMPEKLLPLEYPDRMETRYVSENGGIRWNNKWVNVTSACRGEYVGLEEIEDGVWNVYIGPIVIGRLHEKFMRIEDIYGRLKRKKVLPTSPD